MAKKKKNLGEYHPPDHWRGVVGREREKKKGRGGAVWGEKGRE